MCVARKGCRKMEKKKRFNLVDAIVLLVIVAVVGLVGYKFLSGGVGGSATSTYQIKFFCEEVPSFAAEEIKVGDKILDEQKESGLGTVKEVILDDSVTYTTNDAGDIRIVPKPNYNSVEITAEVEASDYDFGMIVDSSKYGIGHSITIRVGKAKIFGRVSGIEKLD